MIIMLCLDVEVTNCMDVSQSYYLLQHYLLMHNYNIEHLNTATVRTVRTFLEELYRREALDVVLLACKEIGRQVGSHDRLGVSEVGRHEVGKHVGMSE